jgi:AraC-like DNA-binding protein
MRRMSGRRERRATRRQSHDQLSTAGPGTRAPDPADGLVGAPGPSGHGRDGPGRARTAPTLTQRAAARDTIPRGSQPEDVPLPIHVDHHDSPLGRWSLARWRPTHLAGAVEGIWHFEGTLTHLRERHFPDGRLELVVHLGPVYRQVAGERTEAFTPTCVGGIQTGPDVVEAPPGPNTVLGVRLLPAGAFPLLGLPLRELTGLTVDLEDLLGGAARQLADRCAAAHSPGARMRAAADWIAGRLRAASGPDRAVCWMAREIERTGGTTPIGELRARTGWSKTRLTHTFREQVGVRPKTLARIVRFRRALDMVTRGAVPLSRIALDAGYYDQPHFNAEFRELAGVTPGDYRSRLRFPESASLAESAGNDGAPASPGSA